METNKSKAKTKSQERFTNEYILGINYSKNLELSQDAQILAQHIIEYMETKSRKYEFTDFYDPALIKAMRALIKSKDDFFAFLDTISFDIKDFIEISAYIIPHVYTTHLIRFIKTEYLHQKLPKTKSKKKSK